MANYSIREFQGKIDKWIEAAGNGVVDCVEIFSGKVQTALVEGSPVYTGRFRGNWQVTPNRPPLYALNNYDKDGGKTIAEGKRAIHAILRGGGAVRALGFAGGLMCVRA